MKKILLIFIIYFISKNIYSMELNVIITNSLDKSAQPIWIQLPDNYNTTKKKFPLIIAHHGYMGDQFFVKNYIRLSEYCKNKYILVSIYGHGNAFGNILDQLDIKEAVRYVFENFLIDKKNVFGYGDSMGGGSILLFAGKNPSLFNSLVISQGWTDLKKLYNSNLTFIKKAIEQAYGNEINFQEYSPITYYTNFKNIPILFLHGMEDDVVPLYHSIILMKKINNLKTGWADIYLFPFLGHSRYVGDPQLIINFFDRHLKN